MKLFVGNVSYDTTEPELRAVFEPFEPILEFHRPRDRETGQPRGFAFVTLASREMGEAAIEQLNESTLGGRTLRVNEAEDRGSRPPARRMAPEDDITSGLAKPVDDRPTDKKGNKVRYKSI
ncbi:MAG: hypothetical protein WD342_16010 [Verrucomicrobiales bacterium]